MLDESNLEEALLVHVEAAALIAHNTTDRAPLNATQFTTPSDYAHAIDPERTPDFRLWLEATRKEYDLLDKAMGCWEVVDIDTLPEDANLIGVKSKLSSRMASTSVTKLASLHLAINNAKTSITLPHFHQPLHTSLSG
jgi:hypothetical protein